MTRLDSICPLGCSLQVRAASGAHEVLERKPLRTTSRMNAFLLPPTSTAEGSTRGASSSAATAAVAVASGSSAAAVLLQTAEISPRDLIVQVAKFLPADLQASASLYLFPILHHVWHWQKPSPELLSLILLGDEHGLHDLPPLPKGEVLWLDVGAHHHAMMAAGSGEEMLRAQQREQRNLERVHEEAEAATAPTSNALQGELMAEAQYEAQYDHALQRAIGGREAARELAMASGASTRQQATFAPDPREAPPPPTSWLSTQPPGRDRLEVRAGHGAAQEGGSFGTAWAAATVEHAASRMSMVGWRTEELSPELFAYPGLGLGEIDRARVGRWGEELCYEHLRRVCTGDSRAAVEWLNQAAESGLPYDITLTRPDGDVTFIEVKTTSAVEKPFVEVSVPELLFAQRTGAAYHLYRVFGAGTEDVSLACLQDPVNCVSSGGGSLALLLGRMAS